MAVKWCVICSSHYEDSGITPLEGAFNSVKKLESIIVEYSGAFSITSPAIGNHYSG